MKKTGTALFELIHSLAMAEKKYFKMFSSLKGGDKSYLKLYDAIEKQDRYNEDAIRSVCHGQKFLKRLSVANGRLYNNILRSLENYHSSTDINLRSQLNKAEILLRKGLTAQALLLLKKAKLSAYHHEHWELLIEILTMERIPCTSMDLLKIPHLNEEMGAVQQKLSNIKDYRTIHHKIIQQIQEGESMRTKEEQVLAAKLMRHPLLRNPQQASCAEAKTYYYEIRSLYYFFKRDFTQGYKTAKEQCSFIETHLHQLRDPEKRYLFALNILGIFLEDIVPTHRNKYGEMQEVLQKIRSYPITSPEVKATFWISSYINELNVLMRMGDFEKIFSTLKAIEENEDLLKEATAITKKNLYYNIAYMLFGAGRYNEALLWLRKILDQPASELRKDTQALSHILSLLIHYELHKDEEWLDSLKRSALHFLSTRHRFFKMEQAFMHCLRQIMGKAISKKKRSAALQELKTNLLKLRKYPMEKAAMEEFDFLSWVESKIQNKTFAEVVREKAKPAALNP
ncbi:MAG: hypothetical protein HY840_07160 [Bacteroidetes bacterium]|nr:hypothetical protein [Bacteroidota bacterium]